MNVLYKRKTSCLLPCLSASSSRETSCDKTPIGASPILCLHPVLSLTLRHKRAFAMFRQPFLPLLRKQSVRAKCELQSVGICPACWMACLFLESGCQWCVNLLSWGLHWCWWMPWHGYESVFLPFEAEHHQETTCSERTLSEHVSLLLCAAACILIQPSGLTLSGKEVQLSLTYWMCKLCHKPLHILFSSVWIMPLWPCVAPSSFYSKVL